MEDELAHIEIHLKDANGKNYCAYEFVDNDRICYSHLICSKIVSNYGAAIILMP